MLEFVLHNEVKRAARTVFGTKQVIFDTETIYVDSPEFYAELDGTSLYFLINEKLDTTTTAKVILQSQSNYVETTRESYSSNQTYKPFRSYLRVRTQNYGSEFVSFSLTFLKVTPYE